MTASRNTRRPMAAACWLAIAALFALAACTTPPARPTAQPPQPGPKAEAKPRPARAAEEILPAFPEGMETIPIALLLPLSGAEQATGEALLKAAEYAFFTASDPRLRLIVLDTQGTGAGAENAAREAVKAGARAAIGPLLSAAVQAAGPLLRAAGIPTLALTSDARTAQPGVWPLGFAPEADTRRILTYAASHGYRRLAALLPENAYGERVRAALGEVLGRTGLTLVAFARYLASPGALDRPVRRIARYDERHQALLAERAVLESLGDDLSAEILATLEKRDTLGNPGFDALLLAEGDPLIRSLAPLLAYYDVDGAQVRFLGTGLWDDPVVLREPNLEGAWFPAPAPERPRALLQTLHETFGGDFPRIATLAYDAMALIAVLAREPDVNRRLTISAFADPRGFIGVDGPIRLRPDGRVERRLSVIEIRRSRFVVIDPADPHFTGPPIS